MNDREIIELYWNRDERAIPETAHAYGAYCYTIAHNILREAQDAEECVNDTYLRAWNAIPPTRPRILSAFLGRITRNLALSRYHRDRAQKRGGKEPELVFEELADCVSGRETVEQSVDTQELTKALNDFLTARKPNHRRIFVLRYWYAERVSDIAKRLGMTENRVSVILHRERAALRTFLTERGFDL